MFDEIQRFVEETQLIECQVTILTPFPGTRLLKRLEDEGRLLYERFWDRCTLFDLVFKPKQMTPERLVEGHMELMKELYAPEKTQHRRRHYIDIVKALLPN